MKLPFLKVEIHFPFGRPPEGADVLWRCEVNRYSYVIDADRDEYGTTDPRVELRWYYVERRTPKGAWLAGQFVLLSHRKRFAAPTAEEALADFAGRRERQIYILEKNLRKAQSELAMVQSTIRDKTEDAA